MQYFHVSAVKSSTTFSIYVNGVLEDTRALPSFTDSNSANLLIGANALEGAHLNGLIDEAEIFDRALSASEIQAIVQCRHRGQVQELLLLLLQLKQFTDSYATAKTATAQHSNSNLYSDTDIYANADTDTDSPDAPYADTYTNRRYSAQIQQPINANGTSIFSVRRGVVPVKFTLTQNGTPTCALPPATIAVTRTGGGVIGEVNESIYTMPADSGSNFRIDGCQYIYNLNSGALGVGIYRVDIKINGQVVGSATFELK